MLQPQNYIIDKMLKSDTIVGLLVNEQHFILGCKINGSCVCLKILLHFLNMMQSEIYLQTEKPHTSP